MLEGRGWDTAQEKWEWYQKQRQMIKDMIDAQKEYDQRANEQLQDLKEILLDLQVSSARSSSSSASPTLAGHVQHRDRTGGRKHNSCRCFIPPPPPPCPSLLPQPQAGLSSSCLF